MSKIFLTFLATGTLILGACSSTEHQGHNTDSSGQQTETQTVGNHDSHGVSSEESFLIDMIPHHQEAIDTSRRLNMITQDVALKELTDNVAKVQEKEVAMMQGWIREWYPNSTYWSDYTPMMRDTSALSAIATIEKMWLEDMIAHHEGAVKMAESVLKLHPRTEVREFAEAIIRDQSAEITLMQTLLHNYH